jgi:hypothetical protein
MMGRVIAGWAALGVTLTSATQLRMAGPLGPGEALLALWMAVFGFLLLRGMRFSYSNAFRPFAVFWALSAALLLFGSLVAIALQKQDVETAQHDALAFTFVGALSCMLAIRVGDASNEQYYLSLARTLFLTVSAMGLFLLTASLVTSQLGPINLWYGGGARFRGWSHNPNQLAMFMEPMPFLGLYLLKQAQTFGRKLAYASGMVVCVWVGLGTDSDGLKVAWLGAIGAAGVLFWSRLIVKGRGKFLHMAISCFVVPVVALAMALGLGSEIVREVKESMDQTYAKGGRGEIGMAVLRHGLEAMSYSPLVGLGPGAYSGEERPFQAFEAHNTIVDWGMSTGMLGIALYLALLFWCAVGTIRSGSPWLLGALLTMVADSVFGYSLRHPFFWLMLVLVLTLSERTAEQMASSGRPPRKGTMSAPGRPAYRLTMRRSRSEPPASATKVL